MLRMKRTLFVSLLVVSSITYFGCSSTGTDSEGQVSVSEGLTVQVDPSDATRVTGTYARGGHFISFDLRNPTSDPQREMDVMMTDEFGKAFFRGIVGDPPEGPSWNEELALPVDPQVRALDWEFVKELETAIAQLPAGGERSGVYQQALTTLGTISSGMRAQNGPPPEAERPTGDQAQATTPLHYFYIYKEWIGWPIAEHSATKREAYGPTGLASTTYECNHGHCPPPLGGYLSYHCSRYLYASSIAQRPHQNCDTPYGATSAMPNEHNCHDDTLLQLRNFVYNTSYYDGSSIHNQWCHDGRYSVFYAPSCTYY